MTVLYVVIGALIVLVGAVFLLSTQQRKSRSAARLESAFTRAKAYRLTRTGIVHSKPYI